MTDLEKAYKVVNDTEVKIVTDIEAALTACQSALDTIAKVQPSAGASTVARQYLTRALSQVTMLTGFDLTNVKGSYGMNPPFVPPVTVSQT